jgi:hypothetical protein
MIKAYIPDAKNLENVDIASIVVKNELEVEKLTDLLLVYNSCILGLQFCIPHHLTMYHK